MINRLTTGTLRTVLELVLLLVIAVLIFRSCQPDTPVPAVRGTANSTFHWRNKHDQLVAAQKATAEQFALQDAAMRKTLDSVARIYKTESRRIQELVIAAIEGKSDLPPVPGTREIDTLYLLGEGHPVTRMRETFENRWYTAQVQLGDSSYLKLQSRDTLTAMWKVVRQGKWFQKERYLEFNISLADTTRRVTGIRSFRRMETPRELSLNLETEFLFADGLHHLVGLGVERSTRRFNAGVSLYKDFSGFLGGPVQDLPVAGKAHLHYKLFKF